MTETRPQYEVIIYDKKIKDRFLEVVDEKSYNREVIFAKQIFDGNKFLQQCDKESIRNAIVNIALTGATLNPALQQAFIVPRKGKAILDFSYRGLIQIATDPGSIKVMTAQVVYTWDEFEYEQGTKPFIHNKMNLDPPIDPEELAHDPKKIWDYVLCAYSRAVLFDGSEDFIILPKYKLWKIYQSSEGKENAKMPWQTWPEEMIRKSAIKYHAKTLPKNDRLATAVSILNEHEGIKKESTAKEFMSRFNSDEVVDAETKPQDAPQAPENVNDAVVMPENESPELPLPDKKDYTKMTALKGHELGAAIRCPDLPKGKNVRPKSDCNQCAKSADCPAWV